MNPHQSTNDVSPLSHRLLWWLLRLITSLSHANQTILSRWLARLAPIVAGRRMRIVRANLAICFPVLKPSEQEALAKKGSFLNHPRTVRNTDRMGQARAVGGQAP